jgi:hypothetical protein
MCKKSTSLGHALECAACLDVLVAKRKCTAEQIQSGKAILHETVCLLVGLVKSHSPERLREEVVPYGSRGEAGTAEKPEE